MSKLDTYYIRVTWSMGETSDVLIVQAIDAGEAIEQAYLLSVNPLGHLTTTAEPLDSFQRILIVEKYGILRCNGYANLIGDRGPKGTLYYHACRADVWAEELKETSEG